MMAFVGWRIWNVNLPEKNRLRFLFIVQLVLNGVWSFLFFQLRNPLAALVDILLLWFSLFLLTQKVWPVNKQTGFLLLPYIAWVSFAAYLNAAIFWLNR